MRARPPRKLHYLSVRMTRAERAELAAAAAREDIPVSQYVREVLERAVRDSLTAERAAS